jgi:lysozyme family protein
MADFTPAFAKTLAHEGGYSDHPADRGGETYRGIARVFFPDWPGWRRIDAAKRAASFPANLARNTGLQQAVEAFYREHFWNRLGGDGISDQAVAEELFDTAVNMGVRRGGRFLQEALNLLNRNQENYADLVVDGAIGPKTLAALDQLLRLDRGATSLVRLLNLLQGERYVEIMRHDPSQEVFARGWLKRA